MKKYLALFAAFSFVFVMSVSTFAANSQEKEKTLTEKVYKEIVTMPNYGLFDSIGFELDGSTVILSGKVYNGFNRKTAERRVQKLEGVESVVNNIEILPGSSFDDQIRRSVVRSFANTGGISRYLVGPNPNIRIIVDNGRLALEGFVANESDIKLMNILANGTPGVFSVTNNLEVKKSPK